jgi:hypothetical protein
MDFMKAANVPVRHAARAQELEAETLQGFPVCDKGTAESFESYRFAGGMVMSLIHFSHSSASEQPDDFKSAGNLLSWLQTESFRRGLAVQRPRSRRRRLEEVTRLLELGKEAPDFGGYFFVRAGIPEDDFALGRREFQDAIENLLKDIPPVRGHNRSG